MAPCLDGQKQNLSCNSSQYIFTLNMSWLHHPCFELGSNLPFWLKPKGEIYCCSYRSFLLHYIHSGSKDYDNDYEIKREKKKQKETSKEPLQGNIFVFPWNDKKKTLISAPAVAVKPMLWFAYFLSLPKQSIWTTAHLIPLAYTIHVITACRFCFL